MKNVLKVPFRKLKHIHHISDIQIRNLKRHREYEEVFNRLYEKVKEYPDNAIAYIGGDIAHSKTEMSPELIDQLSRLFKNLSDICTTIIISVNHDCNNLRMSFLFCLAFNRFPSYMLKPLFFDDILLLLLLFLFPTFLSSHL